MTHSTLTRSLGVLLLGVFASFSAARAAVLPGEVLLGELNCAACHEAAPAAAARLASRQSPILGAEGARVSPAWIRSFLLNPAAGRPGAMMPDVLHSLPTAAKAEAADALAHYLASLQSTDAADPAVYDSVLSARGKALYHTLGCVACHAPQAVPADNGEAPPHPLSFLDQFTNSLPLSNLAAKYTVSSLAAFLRDPLKTRPSGRMPAQRLSGQESRALATYLLRDQAKAGAAVPRQAGLAYEIFVGQFSKLPDFEAINPLSDGRVPRFVFSAARLRAQMAMRIHGLITVPRDGDYTFWTSSDDGTQLFIDDKLVVDNDGVHAATEKEGRVRLAAGDHHVVLTYFNNAGERALRVSWAGPELEKQEIPGEALFTDDGQAMNPGADFTVDPAKAAHGRDLFVQYNCGACHAIGQTGLAAKKAAPLADLKGLDKGCLATAPSAAAPAFTLTEAQRGELRAVLALVPRLTELLSPADQVHRTLTALNCYACHERANGGAPTPERREYFRVNGKVDLGDEGRIPPSLTGAGAKLKPAWIEKVLVNGASVRPYMGARMPQFGEANVKALVSLLPVADAGLKQDRDIAVDPAARKYGQRMVGTEGSSCIACHVFAGRPSLGVPALDLTTVFDRLNSDWFHRYLLNPPSLRPGTRMPSFWPEGVAANKTILGGDTEKQITAIWSYLSDGAKAELPPGLIAAKMELVADKEPRIFRNFIAGAGSRAIGVGYPEHVNLAFDANQMSVALLWQGGFMDASRHWTGRAEGFQGPLGFDVVRFPDGAPFAVLANSASTWPYSAGKAAGYQFRGYVLDRERRPTFHYLYRQTAIEDSFVPAKMPGESDTSFHRVIALRSPQPVANLWFRAAVGAKIEDKGNGTFLVNDTLRLTFRPGNNAPAGSDVPPAQPMIRKTGSAFELLVPVAFRGGEAEIVEDISW